MKTQQNKNESRFINTKAVLAIGLLTSGTFGACAGEPLTHDRYPEGMGQVSVSANAHAIAGADQVRFRVFEDETCQGRSAPPDQEIFIDVLGATGQQTALTPIILPPGDHCIVAKPIGPDSNCGSVAQDVNIVAGQLAVVPFALQCTPDSVGVVDINADINNAPVFTGLTFSVNGQTSLNSVSQCDTILVIPEFEDEDNDMVTLTFEVDSSSPVTGGVFLDPSSGEFTPNVAGVHIVKVTADDGEGGTAELKAFVRAEADICPPSP